LLLACAGKSVVSSSFESSFHRTAVSWGVHGLVARLRLGPSHIQRSRLQSGDSMYCSMQHASEES
jgi:hypothetical protein